MKGTIKFYNDKKRYGFVTAEDGQDYFIHKTQLGKLKPKQGTTIEFDTKNTDKGQMAINIQEVK